MRNKCKFKVACACDLVPTFEEKQIEWIKCIYHMPITTHCIKESFRRGISNEGKVDKKCSLVDNAAL